jgi:hypothetical protein
MADIVKYAYLGDALAFHVVFQRVFLRADLWTDEEAADQRSES